MNILAIGDLVGEIGLEKLKKEYQKIKEENNIDFVIVNAENVAGGMGISKTAFYDLVDMGVNTITMGNHTWAKRDIFNFLDHDKLIIPANYSEKIPGKGYFIYNVKGKNICVIEVMGRTDMQVLTENPFNKIEKILNKVRDKADIIIVEIHAEATAEKIAMGYFLDGKVTAVYGTHTHVQTADEKILDEGTAYITDIGMTGPIKSVIGMDIAASLKRFNTTLPERYKMAEGECMINGIILEINDETNKVMSIKRINVR